MRKLVALIEAEVINFGGSWSVRNYELYEGEFVQTIYLSANPYWHDVEDITPDHHVIATASILVVSDGGYTGHFQSIRHFKDFLVRYLRADIREVVLNSQ